MRENPDNPSRPVHTPPGFSIALPEAGTIRRLGAGSYEAVCLFDEHDWASFTPCHRRPVGFSVTVFAVLGQISVRCPACNRPWDVLWDPWKPRGRHHALRVG
jgi:hypothetical protein